MGWNALWTESTIYLGGYDLVSDSELPNLKYLLADLCNAINERRDLVGTRYPFPVADGSNDAPVASDFVGLPVEANTGNDLHILFENLVSTVKDFFTGPTYNVWYKPDFSAKWTWATALAEVGITEEDLDVSRALTKTSYESLRSLIELCRYAIAQNIMFSSSGNLTDYYSEDKDGGLFPSPYVGQTVNGSPNSSSDAWGNIEAFSDTSTSSNAYLYYSLTRTEREVVPVSSYRPEWYIAQKTGDFVTFNISYSGPFTAGTLLTYVGVLLAETTGTSPSSIVTSVSAMEGDLDGASFTYTPTTPYPSQTEIILDFLSDDPVLTIEIPGSAPFTFDTSSAPQPEYYNFYSFGLSVTLQSVDAQFDMNTAYSYPA